MVIDALRADKKMIVAETLGDAEVESVQGDVIVLKPRGGNSVEAIIERYRTAIETAASRVLEQVVRIAVHGEPLPEAAPYRAAPARTAPPAVASPTAAPEVAAPSARAVPAPAQDGPPDFSDVPLPDDEDGPPVRSAARPPADDRPAPRPSARGRKARFQETNGKELQVALTSRLDNDGVASDYSHLQ